MFGKDTYKKFKLKCPFCGLEKETTKSGMSYHIRYCNKNPQKVEFKKHSISEETKKKISDSMKLAIKEGRATGWHKRKKGLKSYPEKWFEKIILNEFTDKEYQSELHIGKYRLDFAWPKKMRYIEIDGSQHKEEQRKLSDIKKDSYCKSLGWEVLRLEWSYICSNTREAIEISKNFIDFGKIVLPEWKSEKEIAEEKRAEYLKNKKLDKNGRMNPKILSEKEWERRKKLILESEIDLNKFGFISKLIKKTGLSKKQIYNTLERFKIQHYKVLRV